MALQYEVTKRYSHTCTVYESTSDVADDISSDDNYISELEVDADEAIDERYGSIEIAGETFYASRIALALAEDRYYDMVREEQEFVAENDRDWVEEQIGNMKAGDQRSFNGGILVVCVEADSKEGTRFNNEDFDSVFNGLAMVSIEPCEEKEQGVESNVLEIDRSTIAVDR